MHSEFAVKLLDEAISSGIFPGAAFSIYRKGKLTKGFVGGFTYCPDSPRIDANTVWDLASVSKVISTTSLSMLAFQDGKIDLERAVASYLPEFAVNEKAEIKVRHLLEHNSGLIAFRPFHKTHRYAESVIKSICAEKLTYPTGSKMVYSDLNMIVLQKILELVYGGSLESLLKSKVAEELNLRRTGYWTESGGSFLESLNRSMCAPTERIEDWRSILRRRRYGNFGSDQTFGINPEYIQGEVHDPTATVLGGVAGHAGLFSTLDDLNQFMINFVGKKPTLFDSQVRNEFVRKQSSLSSRALGWDTKSPTGSSAGSLFGPNAFGHTGYTGTAVWAELETESFAILLTNRVHPSSENTKILSFRPKFFSALVEG